jgi:ABC-2 type transport system permease protein
MVKKKHTYKRDDLLQFVLSSAILVVVLIAGQYAFFKVDLTEEKRHTITNATESLLGQLEDDIYIRCYLHGNFPAKYKRLEQAFRELLDEFNDAGNNNIKYEFIDIYESGDDKTIGEIEQAVYKEGLRFSRIGYDDNGAKKFQNIWPSAMLTYKGRSLPIQLLKSDSPDPTDEMINGSINNLEYEMAASMQLLLREFRPAIAILDGHRELLPVEMADLELSLKDNYDVEHVTINGSINALTEKLDNVKDRQLKYDLLIVAKPDSVFDNKDKLIIDQFIMNGGAVLWMVDPMLTDLDSLRVAQQTMAVTNEMGLYDMLFDYGVRMNRNLILDYNAAPIVYDTGPRGNQRGMEVFRWYFAPIVLTSDSAHPIAANLDPIHFDFVSSLDAVGENKKVKHTPLLQTSELSVERKTPVRVHSGISEYQLDFFQNSPHQSFTVAMLLEGEFNSNFTGRIPDVIAQDPTIAFRESSPFTRMIVIGDGDIARNKVMQGADGLTPIPLGYDRMAGRVIYDNKEFLLNAVNYLLNDTELIAVRSRYIKLRKLNDADVTENRKMLQLANTLVPILIIAALGLILLWIRKRKYAR